jgi:hypothetical protein
MNFEYRQSGEFGRTRDPLSPSLPRALGVCRQWLGAFQKGYDTVYVIAVEEWTRIVKCRENARVDTLNFCGEDCDNGLAPKCGCNSLYSQPIPKRSERANVTMLPVQIQWLSREVQTLDPAIWRRFGDSMRQEV